MRAGTCGREQSCAATASEERLIQMMFDKQLTTRIVREERPAAANDPFWNWFPFNTHAEGTAVSLKDHELEGLPGEIVGVAGVSGNGQKELCDAILGMEKIVSGKKLLKGKDFTHKSTGKMRKFGLGFIPENPLTMATVPFMSVMENMAITRTADYSRYRWTQYGLEAGPGRHQEITGKIWFYLSPITHQSKSLSGGNLQRLIIAREMMKEPKLIIASYLTRGLDVQSTLVARQELMNARNAGTGVLLISEDLEELFSLSDRLIVLFEGKIVGEFLPAETDCL